MMKKMTCKQLGGACDEVFRAETFEQMVAQSKMHAMAMFQQQDAPHMLVMSQMAHLMQDPAAMQQFMDEKRQQFDALADD
ncbi:hypothetical protein Q4557_06800 [Shewanella sp. 5_MG-2023]|uniref:hypothetical protein n=1 Tax=Shewanella sp. 5_MG-2023 TaxID=3062656 RepID=UPI0026E179AA|nr:hypothetical protein [Shewanella sp. 5_MG-2023]MDO6639667.1 hypothetical protein [Shewanella sp. 5_MG-2023]